MGNDQTPEYFAKYYRDNKKWISDKRKVLNKRIRFEVLSHFSNGKPKCVICGFGDIRALQLDHINDDGAEHRKGFKSGQISYMNLRKNNFECEYDLQVLCANCNQIKEIIRRGD